MSLEDRLRVLASAAVFRVRRGSVALNREGREADRGKGKAERARHVLRGSSSRSCVSSRLSRASWFSRVEPRRSQSGSWQGQAAKNCHVLRGSSPVSCSGGLLSRASCFGRVDPRGSQSGWWQGQAAKIRHVFRGSSSRSCVSSRLSRASWFSRVEPRRSRSGSWQGQAAKNSSCPKRIVFALLRQQPSFACLVVQSR